MASKEQLALLRQFVDMCKKNPQILHMPELSFYREWLSSLGATLPSQPSKSSTQKEEKKSDAMPDAEPMTPEAPEEEEELVESDLELDRTGVIEEEPDEPLDMGDENIEVTDDMTDKSDEKKSEALEALSNGQHEDAVKLFTEAIRLNPHSAILHAKRASALLKLKKPAAAIRDCSKAIKMNPDSAAPYRFRGRARQLLGQFKEAHDDYSLALKLDYDDTTNEWMKEVEPNAKKIAEHKRKHERKREELETRKREERARKARDAYEKQKAAEKERGSSTAFGEDDDGEPGGDFGAMPGFGDLMNDPETMMLFQDPEVQNAFADISANPANIMKHQANPKVAKVMQKLQEKMTKGGFGGGAGFGGRPPPSAGSSATGGAPKAPDMDID